MTDTHALLSAVRSTPLTVHEAVTWFAAGTSAIGYTMSARAATWLRLHPDGSIEHQHHGDVLADAYEIVLFDGKRELRWLRAPGGRGTAVALGEDPATLPDGTDVTTRPAPRRGDTQTRLLAGTPRAHRRPGWTTLSGDRYAPAHLPLAFTSGDILVIDVIEYLIEDDFGNVDVAETRTAGLRAITHELIPTSAGAAGPTAERSRHE